MADDPSLIRLAGADPADLRPQPPFAPLVLDFLAALSADLRDLDAARTMADVQAFAFWCRPANLERLKAAHADSGLRLGRGLLFHVAPGNVPITFAFSFAFGLLAGCANIVRVPSRPHPVVETVAGRIAALLALPAFAALAAANTLVRHDADGPWSARFSARADGRLIWGGDATIAALRALPTPPRCVDVAFADRTSLCVMDAAAVAALDGAGLERLAHGFFNDTYLMDQNACSSPHLLFWRGDAQTASAAAASLWPALARKVAADYPLALVQAVDKHCDLLGAIMDDEPVAGVQRWGGGLTVLTLAALPADLATRRGRFGLFRQFAAPTLAPLAPVLDGRFQTLTRFGLEAGALGAFILEHRLAGVDRVVPVGQALDMGLDWDGFDLIAQLTRRVDLR